MSEKKPLRLSTEDPPEYIFCWTRLPGPLESSAEIVGIPRQKLLSLDSFKPLASFQYFNV